MCFVGLAVTQVGGGQRVAASDEVVDARRPERLDIEEVASVLLRGPFVAGFADQHVGRNAAHDLLQPRGRAAEPDTEVGILIDRERELEWALEPRRDVAHPFSLVSCSRHKRLRRANGTIGNVVEKHIEISWYVAEGTKEQPNLTAMMYAVIDAMLQEFSAGHGALAG